METIYEHVELYLAAADAAGLPDDARLREA
jgi:hypothetical protein